MMRAVEREGGDGYVEGFAVVALHRIGAQQPVIGPGQSFRLETWVSFHTATTGWLEEYDPNNNIRYAFEILSN